MDAPSFAPDTIAYLSDHSREVNLERVTAAVQYITSSRKGASCDSEIEAHLASLICGLYQRKLRSAELPELLRTENLSPTVSSLLSQNWDNIVTSLEGGNGALNARIFVPTLCDVTWNTSYLLCSGRLRHVMEPICAASLKVSNAQGKIEDVNFECSKEQLSTILYKMKAANAQIEKLIG